MARHPARPVTALAPAVWVVILAASALHPVDAPPGPTAVIAVVAPADANPAVMEALSRFRGEAESVGFEVTVVVGSPTAPPIAQMEAAAHAASAVATVVFVRGDDPRALDVWFTDRFTGKTVFGHVSVDNEAGDRSSVVLAVKAVDFLRARMFDFLVARPGGRVDARSAAAPLAAPGGSITPPPSVPVGSLKSRRVILSIGVGTLSSLQGLGTTVLPLLRAAYDITVRSTLRIILGGLGTRARVTVMGGSAEFAESLLMGEWALAWGQGRVVPLLVVGVGAHDVRAAGAAMAPYIVRTASRVSLATALSAGLRVSVTRRLAVSAEAGAFLLFPQPQVVIAGLEGGRSGRPGLSGALTLEARF